MTEREQFETWALSEQMHTARDSGGNGYFSSHTQIAWEAWQAAGTVNKAKE